MSPELIDSPPSAQTAPPPAPSARRHLAARAGLVLVAAAQAEIAVWGLIDPHSFFSRFPGLGRHWVAPIAPYNEHLLRDFAAAELGFAILLLGAAFWFSRTLVLVAGTAFLAATIPHLVYHVTTSDRLPTADNIASLGAFALEIAIVAAAMLVVVRAQSNSS